MSLSLLYWQLAYGSCNVDVTRLESALTAIKETDVIQFAAIGYILFIITLLSLFLGVIYAGLIFLVVACTISR